MNEVGKKKAWYNLFVSVDEPNGDPMESEGQAPPANAAQAIADIAAAMAPPPPPPMNVPSSASFEEIYQAAEIQTPGHGFTILKVADMLKNPHIKNMPRDVKRSTVLVALDTVGVPVTEVIQDAVRRDKALDTFERVRERALEELIASKTKENQEIQAELDRIIEEYRGRMQANNEAMTSEKEAFFAWRMKKQEEERMIAETVSHFVTENPITLGSEPAPLPPPPPKA